MTSVTSAVAAAGCRMALACSVAEHPEVCGKGGEVSWEACTASVGACRTGSNSSHNLGRSPVVHRTGSDFSSLETGQNHRSLVPSLD